MFTTLIELTQPVHWTVGVMLIASMGMCSVVGYSAGADKASSKAFKNGYRMGKQFGNRHN